MTKWYGDYLVDSSGFIWTKNMKKHISPFINNRGYYQIPLIVNGKRKLFLLHRIIAELFCEKPEGCNVVNHKDFNQLNNDYTNLEWTTQSGNIQHAVKGGRFENRKNK